MRQVVFTAAALAMLSSPAAAEHLYSYGQAPHGVYGVEPQSAYPPPPDARTVVPRGHNYGGVRRGPRTGLDRPYGGHGVPYRTPPQGWPDPPT
jgi:hypothetical protein